MPWAVKVTTKASAADGDDEVWWLKRTQDGDRHLADSNGDVGVWHHKRLASAAANKTNALSCLSVGGFVKHDFRWLENGHHAEVVKVRIAEVTPDGYVMIGSTE